jgi:tetratricopeptide (TPR) repeat protein
MRNDAFDRAVALEAAGNTDEARKAYLAVLAEQPRHLEALSNLGSLLFTTGYKRAGKVAFQEAVKHYPTSAPARANLASALMDEGDHRGAREHFDAALRLDKNNASAHRGIAILFAREGNFEPARFHARKANQAAPVRSLPFRGAPDAEPARVLLVTSALGGNVDTERIIDNRIFACDTLIAEFYDPTIELPTSTASSMQSAMPSAAWLRSEVRSHSIRPGRRC